MATGRKKEWQTLREIRKAASKGENYHGMESQRYDQMHRRNHRKKNRRMIKSTCSRKKRELEIAKIIWF